MTNISKIQVSRDPQTLLEALEKLNQRDFGQQRHSNANLRDHLTGTCEILKSWAVSESVCLAGLCHSIYGTQYFWTISVTLEHRSQVRALIGKQAEHLSYLFCAMDRTEFYEHSSTAKKQPAALVAILDRFTGETTTLDEGETRDLLTIAAANLLEQWPRMPSAFGEELRRIWQVNDRLPKSARQAMAALLAVL